MVLERAERGRRHLVGTTPIPGCACDVPSHLYSFSFAPNPDWSEPTRKQPEIRAYLQRCADEFGLRAAPAARHDGDRRAWDEDARPLADRDRAGALPRARARRRRPAPRAEDPRHPRARQLPGRTFHSARWDHDYDLTGKRVASIGTGASAIQFVPEIQPHVEQLHVFQRTAAVGHAPHRPADHRVERRLYRRFPPLQRLVRGGVYARPRAARARLRQEPEADEARRAASRAGTCAAQISRPRAAREGHARLHDRLQADPALEPVVSGARASPTSSS